MSGIAGIFDTGGAPADELALRRVLEAIAHRGPDHRSSWTNGQVALGRRLLPTLPGDADGDAIPVDGECAIVADARIDNREDLAIALGLAEGSMTDAALILAAYRRWGDDSPRHLIGDFAFVIWDGRRRAVFCARDCFGVKPFFYCQVRGRFAFASEMRGLFALPEVSPSTDEARIADFLVGLVPEVGATSYREIRRLPPRHTLTVTERGSFLREYWRPESPPAPSRDPAEEFRDIFEKAVRSRLYSSARVGAMLSGGLDSSSIACMASRLGARGGRGPLPTLSLSFRPSAFDEGEYVEEVLAQGGFEPIRVEAARLPPFADLDAMLDEQEELFHAPGLAFGRELYRTAAGRGVRVLLDGHGGDDVVSHGVGRLKELARASRWLKLWREAGGIARLHGEPVWPIYRKHLARSGGRLGRLWRGVSGDKPARTDHERLVGLVAANLAARTHLRERLVEQRRAEASAARDPRSGQAHGLLSGRVPRSFEVLDRAAAAQGIEPRYPFWDRRLVEFCLALPAEEKLRDGWSRHVLRRAMEGILPPAVQWRRDKLDFGPHIARGMLTEHRALIESVIADRHGVLGGNVDLTALRDAYLRVEAKPEAADGEDMKAISRSVVLSAWLRQRESASAQTPAAA